MELLTLKARSAWLYTRTFLKWIAIAVVVGIAGGGVGTLFDKCVEFATGFRTENDWLIWLLPLGGLAIVAIYKISKLVCNTGTNQIIECIRSDKKLPIILAPLIFISTFITHLFGGSAGREGAALQLGGSIGNRIGCIFKLDDKDMHIVTLCGMSAVFSALFGTPVTAAIFSMEVISVGVLYYSAFVPCITSALTAYGISVFCGVEPVRFSLLTVPGFSVITVSRTVILAILCAIVSIIFCISLHKTEHAFRRFFKSEYIRITTGAVLLIALTYIVGTRAYNGVGMDVIANAMNGRAQPLDFFMKILFTAITIGSGFKGGEIVPTFFIGSTFGCIAGGLLGLDPSFGAALGFVALFCGVVNCPVSSIILSVEIFGSSGLILFAVACAVTYMLSGNYSLYSSQKLVYSKLKAEFINIYAE